MTVVYITGVFDILHKGHLKALKRAKALGDFLVVGVQEDEYAEKDKGKKPILSTSERVEQMRELPFVDKVIIYGVTTVEIMKEVRPDIFCFCETWLTYKRHDSVIEYMINNGIIMNQLPYTGDISSSEIERRICANRV